MRIDRKKQILSRRPHSEQESLRSLRFHARSFSLISFSTEATRFCRGGRIESSSVHISSHLKRPRTYLGKLHGRLLKTASVAALRRGHYLLNSRFNSPEFLAAPHGNINGSMEAPRRYLRANTRLA